ncbi:hypothetical protein Scep_010489 [Stephania cephalantha]|uniref:Uncharacterized protein n=1 Tax=Stephania cephalantha TaxID=152367 RepID=A0AAP0JWF4_9MAGN
MERPRRRGPSSLQMTAATSMAATKKNAPQEVATSGSSVGTDRRIRSDVAVTCFDLIHIVYAQSAFKVATEYVLDWLTSEYRLAILSICGIVEHLMSPKGNSIMASYTHNYGQFEDSYYHAVNGVDITIAQYDDDEAEKEIEVISERSEEPQKENEEDQPLVLVKPPTLPCIFVKPYTGVEVKERSWIFYTADTFVLDDHDSTDSFVLEVPNELPILKEGVHDALPKYVDAPFVVDISKGEGIT